MGHLVFRITRFRHKCTPVIRYASLIWVKVASANGSRFGMLSGGNEIRLGLIWVTFVWDAYITAQQVQIYDLNIKILLFVIVIMRTASNLSLCWQS